MCSQSHKVDWVDHWVHVENCLFLVEADRFQGKDEAVEDFDGRFTKVLNSLDRPCHWGIRLKSLVECSLRTFFRQFSYSRVVLDQPPVQGLPHHCKSVVVHWDDTGGARTVVNDGNLTELISLVQPPQEVLLASVVPNIDLAVALSDKLEWVVPVGTPPGLGRWLSDAAEGDLCRASWRERAANCRFSHSLLS